MTNLVLLHKSSSKYNDQPEKHYHFPNRSYLKAMKEAVGEWVVYFEPQGNSATTPGRHVYFAAARIDHIDPDPADPDRSYARIVDYIDFPNWCRLGVWTARITKATYNKPDGATNAGLRQHAVRRIDTDDFHSIWDIGLRVPEDLVVSDLAGLSESISFYRTVVPHTGNRKVRDPLFRAAVLRTYDSCCAFTDLRILNGSNRAEVDAAHIVPVGHNHQGNDSVRNGLALSKTMHWLFDRGILAVGDDYRIMESPGRLPDKIKPLFRPSGIIRVPKIPGERPNPEYLRYHRQMFEDDYGRFEPLALTE